MARATPVCEKRSRIQCSGPAAPTTARRPPNRRPRPSSPRPASRSRRVRRRPPHSSRSNRTIRLSIRSRSRPPGLPRPALEAGTTPDLLLSPRRRCPAALRLPVAGSSVSAMTHSHRAPGVAAVPDRRRAFRPRHRPHLDPGGPRPAHRRPAVHTVKLLEVGKEHFLVALHHGSDWPRNLRAAAGPPAASPSPDRRFRALELPPQERTPISAPTLPRRREARRWTSSAPVDAIPTKATCAGLRPTIRCSGSSSSQG